MRRSHLQHVILEIGQRFGLDGCYVIGAAAILAVLAEPPIGILTATRDVDVIAPTDEETWADRFSFVLGEASDFDVRHGYYVQGVTSRTPASAPRGWKSRCLALAAGPYTAWCLEPHDLVLSKLGAGRPKDLSFSRALVGLGLVRHDELRLRLATVAGTPAHRERLYSWIDAAFA